MMAGVDASASELGVGSRRARRVYDAAFKLRVVQLALQLPPSSRIKPTCAALQNTTALRLGPLPRGDRSPNDASIMQVSCVPGC